jgi:hypothetical protein
MMMHAVANAVQPVRYAIWRKIMSEPMWMQGDRAALEDDCEECGNFIHSCECDTEDPDRLHDEMGEE